jgi:hypothetical protein
MSSLVFIHLSSHDQDVLLSGYTPVPLEASNGYVKTISNDVVQTFLQLVPPLISLAYVKTISKEVG